MNRESLAWRRHWVGEVILLCARIHCAIGKSRFRGVCFVGPETLSSCIATTRSPQVCQGLWTSLLGIACESRRIDTSRVIDFVYCYCVEKQLLSLLLSRFVGHLVNASVSHYLHHESLIIDQLSNNEHQLIIADASRLSAMLLCSPQSFGPDLLSMVESFATQRMVEMTSLATSYESCEQAMANG